MSKHSPTPWEYDGLFEIRAANGDLVVSWEKKPAKWQMRNIRFLCASANAHQDLFKAAKWAARSYHHPNCGVAKGKTFGCSCHVGAAQAAIAKAEGRT